MKLVLLPCLVLLSALCAAIAIATTNNITEILASHPSYSTFSRLCSETGVAAAILSRDTITVLAPPNAVLDPIALQYASDTDTLYAIASFHVLLDYFDTAKFRAIAKGTTLSTTLYQTTGQASGREGFVNITLRGSAIDISSTDGHSATVVQNELFKDPYNISVVSISTALVPSGIAAPGPTSAPVNFTDILIQDKNYNTFLSLLNASGVNELLLKHDVAPGLTVFAPEDSAFKKLPAGVLSNLSSAEQVALLEFHCLGTFYSTQELSALGSRQSTLASGSGGGQFQYRGIFPSPGGGLEIDTGFNKVPLGDTLYSQLPLGLYSISEVLLPTDFFGVAAPSPTPAISPSLTPSPTPAASPTPAPSPAPTTSTTPSPGPKSIFSPPAPPLGPSAPGTPGASQSSSHLSVHFGLCALLGSVNLFWVFFH